MLLPSAIGTLLGSTSGLPSRLKDTLVNIELALDPTSRNEAFRLRYRVYVEEQAKPYESEGGLLRDSLDDVWDVYILRANGRVVGTVRVGMADEPRFVDAAEPFRLERLLPIATRRIAVISRLAVAAEQRHSMILPALAIQVYVAARLRGASLGICHVNERFVPLFRRIGFRPYAAPFVDDVAGVQVPIALVGPDEDHFKAVGSPLAALTKWFYDDPQTRAWARTLFMDDPAEVQVSA
jgi:predicted GNAT family N-acyltransferase